MLSQFYSPNGFHFMPFLTRPKTKQAYNNIKLSNKLSITLPAHKKMAIFKRISQKIQSKISQHFTLNLYHTCRYRIPNIKALYHKDWLSPSDVVSIFNTLPPNSVLPAFRHVSNRKDYIPNLPLYNLLIIKLSLINNFQEIDNIFNLIKTHKDLRFSDDFFYNLIRVYGYDARFVTRAADTLLDMPRFDCWPSVQTFNYVLNLLVTSKKYDLVQQVFAAAPKLGVQIDACSLNIIVKGLCARRLLDNALQVFDEFPVHGYVPNKRTYSTVMHCMCRMGRVDDAFAMLDRMEKDGVSPDAVTFNVLLSGLRKLGKVDETMGWLDKMSYYGCCPNKGTHLQVLYGLLKDRRFVEALKFVEVMRTRRLIPSFVAYKLLVEGLCQEGMLGDVEGVFHTILGAGCIPRTYMWQTVLRKMFGKHHTGKLLFSSGLVAEVTIQKNKVQV